MIRQTPLPIEIALPSNMTLRGLEYAEDGAPVVLVHDIGGDVDSWGHIPAELARQGFRSIGMELRGHGLSDGEVDPGLALQDLRDLLGIMSGSFGPLGLVSYGSVATAAFALGPVDGAPVHCLVSPLPNDDVGDVKRMPAIRAILVGSKDQASDAFVRSVYSRIPGQNMWFSTGTEDSGPTLLEKQPHMLEQLSIFLRRYLTDPHLAWVARNVKKGVADGSG